MHRMGSSEPFSALMRHTAANALRLAPAWLAMAAASSCRPAETAGDSAAPETATRPMLVQRGESLPSWKAGPQKQAIIDFVTRVTEDGAPSYVPPGERIAVFDNDGTLWSEQPMYVQLAFALDRVRELAPKHPDWKEQQPFKGVLEGDAKAVGASGERGLVELMVATHLGNTTDEFAAIVTRWLGSARHPRFNRPYTELVYQPMLELIGYLREHEFKVFIVSGGGVEFMRPWVERVYGVPRERVIGSRAKVKYEVHGGVPVLQRLGEIELVDDKAGKPVGIHELIGQRPTMAFGNSDGDFEMLEWTTTAPGARLGVLIHHTDAEREWAYDRSSHFGQLVRALDEAPRRGWVVVDMKRDWASIYPFEK
jgi:phosphoserine phosphatase